MGYELNPFTRKLDKVGTGGGTGAGLAASITGNTAGVPALVSSGTLFLAGGNNVTLSQNANSITISGGAAGAADGVNAFVVNGGASTASTTLALSNSNGVSFGLNAGTITATVRTDYQSAGAYLTTARASNDAIGLNTALTANGLSVTANSSGLSINVPAWLTTAMQSASSSVFAKTGFTSASTAGTDIVGTLNTNGLSVGIPKYITTAQPVGAYLTTARASNDAVGLNTAQTNVTWTVNSSGISLNAGAYLTTAQPVGAYLTTARASNDAVGLNTAGSNITWTANSSGLSIDARGYAGTGTSATNASVTLNSNGLAISVAAPGGIGGAYIAGMSNLGNTSGTTGVAASQLLVAGGNGVTLSQSLDALSLSGTVTISVATNYQSQGAYLTTARASNDAVGLNTAITNGTWTVNSSGISLNLSNHLTTAAQSSASNVSGVIAATASNGATNQTAQLSGAVSFANGSGVSFFTTANGAVSGVAASVKTDYQSSNANYLTSQSNQAVSNSAGSFTFQTLNFSNANNVTFGTSAGGIVTASVATNYQSQGAYLTTARASNDAVGLNTAQTNVTWTVNSSGISLNAGAYLTTAMASNRGSDFVQANAAFAGTNASGTIASNGISVSVAAPGGGAAVTASASNGSFTVGQLGFSNANNVTFGTSAGSIITASVAAPGAAAENNWFALTGANTAGNTTASGSTIGLSGINLTLSGTNGSGINISAPATSSLSATGQVSISTNGSTISIGVPSAVTVSRYNEFKESPMVAGEIGNASLHLQPWLIPNLHMDRVVLHKAISNASNSSFSFTVSDWVGIYTQNVSTLSLLTSVAGNTNFSGSGTAGSYLSYGGGVKAVTLGLTQTLTEGMYWIGVIQRTTTGGGAGHTVQQVLNSQINSSYRGLMGVATNATNQMSLGFGVYTVSTAGMPNSIAFTQVNGNSSVFLRPPSLYFVSGTI